MAKPIAFGTYQFKTKKSATEEARNRINQYEAGERLRLEYGKYRQALDYIRAKGYSAFLAVADKWTNAHGRYPP